MSQSYFNIFYNKVKTIQWNSKRKNDTTFKTSRIKIYFQNKPTGSRTKLYLACYNLGRVFFINLFVNIWHRADHVKKYGSDFTNLNIQETFYIPSQNLYFTLLGKKMTILPSIGDHDEVNIHEVNIHAKIELSICSSNRNINIYTNFAIIIIKVKEN